MATILEKTAGLLAFVRTVDAGAPTSAAWAIRRRSAATLFAFADGGYDPWKRTRGQHCVAFRGWVNSVQRRYRVGCGCGSTMRADMRLDLSDVHFVGPCQKATSRAWPGYERGRQLRGGLSTS